MIRIILCLLLAFPVLAQKAESPKANEFPFAFGPWGLSALQKEVGLSDTQMGQLREIYQSQRPALTEAMAEVEKMETNLQILLDGSQVDLALAERAVDELLKARSQLAKANTMMMVRMRKVVTQEQWRRMSELQRELQRKKPAPPEAKD